MLVMVLQSQLYGAMFSQKQSDFLVMAVKLVLYSVSGNIFIDLAF